MPRYKAPPLCIDDILLDGPPVRVRDLLKITGLSKDTVYRDIASGLLHAFRRRRSARSHYFVDRDVARIWLSRIGFLTTRTGEQSVVVVMRERKSNNSALN